MRPKMLQRPPPPVQRHSQRRRWHRLVSNVPTVCCGTKMRTHCERIDIVTVISVNTFVPPVRRSVRRAVHWPPTYDTCIWMCANSSAPFARNNFDVDSNWSNTLHGTRAKRCTVVRSVRKHLIRARIIFHIVRIDIRPSLRPQRLRRRRRPYTQMAAAKRYRSRMCVENNNH